MQRRREYFVYIIGNEGGMLYVGVTNNLERRMREHKTRFNPQSYAARWGIHRLLYYESFRYILDAIAREKQIKKYRRQKKIKLIESMNPTWHDLSAEWPLH